METVTVTDLQHHLTKPGRRRRRSWTASKLEDLVRKYSLSVQLGLTQALVVPLPVRAISVRLIRKKQERFVLLHWNAASRALDTPLCEACSVPARPLYLCEKVSALRGLLERLPGVFPGVLRGLPAALQVRDVLLKDFRMFASELFV